MHTANALQLPPSCMIFFRLAYVCNHHHYHQSLSLMSIFTVHEINANKMVWFICKAGPELIGGVILPLNLKIK